MIISLRPGWGGVKIVVFEHNTPDFLYRKLQNSYKASILQELYRRIYSWPRQLKKDKRRHLLLLKTSDRYVVLAKGYEEVLRKVCKISKDSPLMEKVRFINNPLTPIENYSGLKKEKIILFVGQIGPQKRVDKMLDLWASVNDIHGWTLMIVGDGPLMDKMKERVETQKLTNVVFEGYQQPDIYYCKAKIFWMTSDFEGWPMTLTEAMSHGCVPVVYNTFAACEDIIDNDLNGYLIEEGGFVSFIKATRRLMADEEKWNQMSKAARDKTDTWGEVAITKKWEALLSELEKNK